MISYPPASILLLSPLSIASGAQSNKKWMFKNQKRLEDNLFLFVMSEFWLWPDSQIKLYVFVKYHYLKKAKYGTTLAAEYF